VPSLDAFLSVTRSTHSAWGGAGVSVFELRDSNDAQDSSGRMDAARGPRCADRTGGPGCPDGAPGQESLEGPLPRKRRQRAAAVTTTKTSQAWNRYLYDQT
jgi:hypothetical protein